MPSGVFEITDIPAEKVATVIANYQLEDPPPQIEKSQQPNGRWTVTATFSGPGKQKKAFDG
jgi:hypothetical protein